MKSTNNVFEFLDRIEEELRKNNRPTTLAESLKLESCRLFTYAALDICRQKLEGHVNRESLDKVKSTKKYFDYLNKKKNFEEDEECRDILTRLYG